MNRIKLLLITVAVFTFFLSTPSHDESVTGKEYQAVVETAYNYFNGAANGDQKLLSKDKKLQTKSIKL